ncbi:MAG: peptide chain release factor N(5)-glutamine methyltransferase [Saprospirales bacterium]|nr:peptide chain release factor N(5)-glutamine methyltransferase [Saprospirales bacterium]
MATKFYGALLEALEPIYGIGEAASISRIVVEDVVDLEKRFEEILSRLLRNEPVQYILGQADFYGLKFEVNPDVLIPRQETEELVYWVLESCKGLDMKGKRLLDVGTGSGCIPIVLKKKIPALEVVSVDISTGALEVARSNAEKHQVAVDFRQLNFLDPQTWPGLGTFDLIVSNPPYIDPSEKAIMPEHVWAFEPHQALFTTNDPMEFYISLTRFANKNLLPGGKIFVEGNEFRLEMVVETFKKAGFDRIEQRTDMSGKSRMISVLG